MPKHAYIRVSRGAGLFRNLTIFVSDQKIAGATHGTGLPTGSKDHADERDVRESRDLARTEWARLYYCKALWEQAERIFC